VAKNELSFQRGISVLYYWYDNEYVTMGKSQVKTVKTKEEGELLGL